MEVGDQEKRLLIVEVEQSFSYRIIEALRKLTINQKKLVIVGMYHTNCSKMSKIYASRIKVLKEDT